MCKLYKYNIIFNRRVCMAWFYLICPTSTPWTSRRYLAAPTRQVLKILQYTSKPYRPHNNTRSVGGRLNGLHELKPNWRHQNNAQGEEDTFCTRRRVRMGNPNLSHLIVEIDNFGSLITRVRPYYQFTVDTLYAATCLLTCVGQYFWKSRPNTEFSIHLILTWVTYVDSDVVVIDG